MYNTLIKRCPTRKRLATIIDSWFIIPKYNCQMLCNNCILVSAFHNVFLAIKQFDCANVCVHLPTSQMPSFDLKFQCLPIPSCARTTDQIQNETVRLRVRRRSVYLSIDWMHMNQHMFGSGTCDAHTYTHPHTGNMVQRLITRNSVGVVSSISTVPHCVYVVCA